MPLWHLRLLLLLRMLRVTATNLIIRIHRVEPICVVQIGIISTDDTAAFILLLMLLPIHIIEKTLVVHF